MSGSDVDRRKSDVARWLTPPAPREVFAQPNILTAQAFATPAICDWLIERARPRLTASKVYDPSTGQGQDRTDIRNNSAASFTIADFDLVLVMLRARVAQFAGVREEDFEPPMVLHYAAGEQFAPHFDFIEPSEPSLAADIARHGQRVGTFLLYLNDGYEGGETAFSDLGWQHKGAKGDALLFWNTDAEGQPDRRTLHAGTMVTAGEKWVLSQWIRRKGV